jgi:hypothetical protein
MYDEYEPVPAVACPSCGAAIGAWQGTDGPCRMLVWRQGSAQPVGQLADARLAFDRERLAEFRLPREFTIAGLCSTGHDVTALGRCADGRWNITAVAGYTARG